MTSQNHPPRITGAVEMIVPNDKITLFEGIVIISESTHQYEIQGTVSFDWFPSIGVRIAGELTEGNLNDSILRGVSSFSVSVDGETIGEAFLSGYTASTDAATRVKLIMNGDTIFGDKSISVSKVLFSVPNLRGLGSGDRIESDKDDGWYRGRCVLTTGKFTITLDRLPNYESLSESLRNASGYVILYTGCLTSSDGQISFQQAREILNAFSHYISFVNGRRCRPLFRLGLHNDEVLWKDFTGFQNELYKYVQYWPIDTSVEGHSEAWGSFYDLWKSNDDVKDVLRTAIHWYVEANGNAGAVEGSLIMIQTALELLYNWEIVERRKLIRGNDAMNLSASNKIRQLLAHIGITADYPEAFADLQDVDGTDAPEAFVSIRNAIVHNQQEKRSKLVGITNEARLHALNLGLWYVELSLLKVLQFKGQYKNRGSTKGGQFKATLPWNIK